MGKDYSAIFLGLVAAIFFGLATLNIVNGVRRGTTSAYGHVYSRLESPGAFWTSIICSLIAVVLGAVLMVVALAGTFGIFG